MFPYLAGQWPTVLLSRQYAVQAIKLLAAALIYTLPANLMLSYFSINGLVGLIWPSSGWALTILLVGGRRYAFSVFLGAYLTDWWIAERAPWVAFVMACGCTLEALIGHSLLKHTARFNLNLHSLRDFLLLVRSALLSPVFSAYAGVTALWGSGLIDVADYGNNVLHWWVGNALGIVLVTPFLLIWRQWPPACREANRTGEGLIWLGLSFLLGQIIFMGWFADLLAPLARGHWMYPLVAWGALRLGLHAIALALLIIAIQALWGAYLNIGYFTSDLIDGKLANTWVYLFALSNVGIALATYTNERRYAEARSRLSALVFEHSNEGIVVTDVQNRILSVNPMFSVITGYAPEEVIGQTPGMILKSGRQTEVFYQDMWRQLDLKNRWQGEIWNRRKNGEHYLEWLSIAALRDDRGAVVHYVAIFSDITERKQAEDVLRQNREELERAQTIAHIGSWRLDMRSGSLTWSSETYRIFGKPAGTPLSYIDFLERAHPDDRASVNQTWLEAAFGKPYIVEYRILLNGSVRWVHEQADLEFDCAGILCTGIGTVQDITERKVADLQIQQDHEQQAVLRHLLEIVLEGGPVDATLERCLEHVLTRTWLSFKPRGVIYIVETDGLRLGAAHGIPLETLEHYLHLNPGESALEQASTELSQSCMDSDETHLPCVQVTLPITSHWRLLGILKLFLPGNVTQEANKEAFLVSVADILAGYLSRKQAEQVLLEHQMRLEETVLLRTLDLEESRQRLETIIENLPVVFFIKDNQGRYQMLNRCCEEAIGKSRSEILNRTDLELFPAKMARAFMAKDRQVFGEKATVSSEDTLPHADGMQHDYQTTLFPLFDARGQVYALAGIGADITQIKQLQREILAAKEAAERLARLKSEFLANMSHEIRTPLNAVLGFARMGERDNHGRQTQELFHRIGDAGRHLLGIVNDILDFSKIEAGKLSIETQPFQLRSVIETAVGLIAERAGDKGLAVRIDTVFGLPDWLQGDALRLGQILANLLSNAVKFTERGQITVSVFEQPGGLLVFCVADTGIGLAEENLARVFSAFEQADGSITRQYGGTGLGLTISRHLARMMGGDLTVASRLGEGSTFTLSLPLVAVTAPLPTHTPLSLTRQAHRLRGVRVLAAEDVETNRLILDDLLTNEAASVVFAENGQQALDYVRSSDNAFDLVLMDVQMPVMDGREATRQIRKWAPQLPILGLTAHALPEERQQCLEAGMLDVVTKPIDAENLITTMCRYLPGLSANLSNDAAPMLAPSLPAVTEEPPLEFIDWPALLTRFKGRRAFIIKLMATMRASHAETPDKLRAALQAQDWTTLAFIAHGLKGLGGSLEAASLQALAKDTESAARAEQAEETQRLAVQLAALLEAVLTELAQIHS